MQRGEEFSQEHMSCFVQREEFQTSFTSTVFPHDLRLASEFSALPFDDQLAYLADSRKA
jgi:hypothetical protein